MLQIRNDVFETNSSSSHCLVDSKKDRGHSYDLPVDEDGNLVIELGQYGWGPDVLKTPYEKLCYIMTDIAQSSGYYDTSAGFEDLREGILRNSRAQDIFDSIEEFCNIDVSNISFTADDDFYIDHQSAGMLYNEDLVDVIFNNNLAILIDNDNSCYFDDYFTDWLGNPPKEDIEELFDK